MVTLKAFCTSFTIRLKKGTWNLGLKEKKTYASDDLMEMGRRGKPGVDQPSAGGTGNQIDVHLGTLKDRGGQIRIKPFYHKLRAREPQQAVGDWEEGCRQRYHGVVAHLRSVLLEQLTVGVDNEDSSVHPRDRACKRDRGDEALKSWHRLQPPASMWFLIYSSSVWRIKSTSSNGR